MSARRGGSALALAPLLALFAWHADAPAATTNAFLPPSGGPRIAALGGHVVMLVSDDQAIEVNPARLVFAGRVVSFQVDQLDPDLDLWRGRAGVAFGAGDELADAFRSQRPRAAAFGFSLDGMSLRLIEASAYRELTVSGSAALCLTNFSSVGVTARWQRASTDVFGASATGYGVDFGLALNVSDHWDAGLSIRDAFGRAKFESSDDEDHAARLTIGVASIGHRRWQAEANYVFQYDHNAAASLGLEVHVVPGLLDLRGGVSREMIGFERTVATGGLGIAYRKLALDYAYGSDADGAFDQQHRVSLSARF
jgi:hypothetical protein